MSSPKISQSEFESEDPFWIQHENDLQNYIGYKLQGVDPTDIQDIFQEVTIAAAAFARKNKRPEKPEKWLRGVARHKIQDYWRKEAKHPSKVALFEGIECGDPSPYEWVLSVEKRSQINQAVEKLSNEERILLEKKYITGDSCAAISRASGKSIKAIEYQLSKARNSLRALLIKTL